MKLNDAFPSNYLKAADFEQPRTVKIEGYKMETLGTDKRLVLNFTAYEKGMVCNKTNASRIAMLVGSDNLNDWIGRKIVVGRELIDYQGKTDWAIRVKDLGETQAPAKVNEAAPFDEGF
jgi:hypothetical protein